MGFKVDGILGVQEMLLNLDMNTKRRVTTRLYEQAVELRNLARKMAPEDMANLEYAIKVSPESIDGVARDSLGHFARREFKVYVDMNDPAPHLNDDGSITKGTENKLVGDYAYYVHEYVHPAGNNKLGERSALKQMGQNEEVGGAFMTRAAEEIQNTLLVKLVSEIPPVPRWPSSESKNFHSFNNRDSKGRFTKRV